MSAFMRAIKDTFPPARGAGVLALATTQQYFLLSEVANRILPALCTLTVDPDKTVRDHTFKTLRGFLGKLERVSEDPSLRERMGRFLRNFLWWKKGNEGMMTGDATCYHFIVFYSCGGINAT